MAAYYTPSQKFPTVRRKVGKRAKTIHPRQDKAVRLSGAAYVETVEECALETQFPGGSNTEQKRKAWQPGPPTACFTSAASRTATLLECVRASHWRKTLVADSTAGNQDGV